MRSAGGSFGRTSASAVSSRSLAFGGGLAFLRPGDAYLACGLAALPFSASSRAFHRALQSRGRRGTAGK